jgi:ABC-type Fe3+-siderophore transport system, permease component
MSASRRFRLLALFSTALVLGAAALGLMVGPAVLSPAQLIHGLIDGDPMTRDLILQLRLPRVLLGLLVGAVLAICGAGVQAVFRNPLAEPGLIGVSAGAALSAALVLTLWPALLASATWSLPLAAFGGAALTTWLVATLARGEGYTRVSTLLLVGLALNAAAGAGVGLLAILAGDQGLRSVTLWLFGNLGAAGWPQIGLALPALLAPLIWLPLRARALDALLLGETEAAHLGVAVEPLKRGVLLAVVLGTGAAVALTGIIGFIGLLVPHLARLLVGVGHRRSLLLSALLGAALLTLADTLARGLTAPIELPVGLVTALLGAPLFLLLLLRLRGGGERL